MFLIDHAPQVATRARRVVGTARNVSSLVYEGLLRPIPAPQAILTSMSVETQKLRHRSLEEREMMHRYATSLLYGDERIPAGMERQLAIKVQMMLLAHRYQYKRSHPIRARHMVVR